MNFVFCALPAVILFGDNCCACQVRQALFELQLRPASDDSAIWRGILCTSVAIRSDGPRLHRLRSNVIPFMSNPKSTNWPHREPFPGERATCLRQPGSLADCSPVPVADPQATEAPLRGQSTPCSPLLFLKRKGYTVCTNVAGGIVGSAGASIMSLSIGEEELQSDCCAYTRTAAPTHKICDVYCRDPLTAVTPPYVHETYSPVLLLGSAVGFAGRSRPQPWRQ